MAAGPARTDGRGHGRCRAEGDLNSRPDKRRALTLLGNVGYAALFAVCALLSVTGLALGSVAALDALIPGVAGSPKDGGGRWADAVMASAQSAEPMPQLVLDYGFSLLSLWLAGTLLIRRERTWAVRLLALAVVGSAGAFNLQAHAAVGAVETVADSTVGLLFRLPLSGLVCAAYLLALTLLPRQPDDPAPARSTRSALFGGGGTLLVIGVATAMLPQATCSVVLLGVLVPVAGSGVLWGNIRRAPLVAVRTQSRQMFSVLAAAFAVTVVLLVLTLALWAIHWDGLNLVDPTVGASGSGGQPIALLFWFSRLVCVVIPGAVIVATRRGGSFSAEHLFSRGLVAAVVAALVAGGYILLRALGELVVEQNLVDETTVAAVAILPIALVSLPLYVRVERAVDRLLYGRRPTPYHVLAGIAALSRRSPEGPDLARLAEAVGRDLGASVCRLTVTRPGLRDRVYSWTAPGVTAEPAVEVAVWHGAERIGSITVNQGAVAGLQGQRQRLLEDVAESLGAVFQANRAGIELERQLRAALAYADGIAMSRRAVVAEMDWERRRIERDLHDGAQHHLVSLRLTLGLVEHQVSTGQLDQARARLAQIVQQIDVAQEILAETAMEVSSPPLAEFGLVRALRGQLKAGQPPVPVDARGVDERLPIPSDVETAVYFCCLEAVNNARKHAGGAAIEVRLQTADGHLRFVVRDQGPGWDMTAGTPSTGRGIRNLTARIAMVAGWVDVRSTPGVGTTVEGSAPLRLGASDAPSTTGVHRAVAAAMIGSQPLIDQVGDALRAAREVYHNTRHAGMLREMAERLDGPLRVAVSGPPRCGVGTLVEALRLVLEVERAAAQAVRPAIHLIDLSGALPSATTQKIAFPEPGPAPADASIVLLVHRRDNSAPVDRFKRRSALTIGVLARVDELGAIELAGPGMALGRRAAAELAARPDVRGRCVVVVPVAGLLAHAAATLTDVEFATLRELSVPSVLLALATREARDTTSPIDTAELSGSTTVAIDPADDVTTDLRVGLRADSRADRKADLSADVTTELKPRAAVDSAVNPAAGSADDPALDRAVGPALDPADDSAAERLRRRFGPAGVRLAVDLIRSGRAPTVSALAAELNERSGLHELMQQVVARFGRRADGICARSALWALEALVNSEPPPRGAHGLRYRIDQIRSSAHELAELDLLDRLSSGELALPVDQQESAARLLGALGTEPRVRLALAPEAGARDVAAAAAQQLEHWRALAVHGVTSKDVRDVAATLVQTCEHLLAGPSPR